jgi:N-acetylneuraminic acid mutarotase
VNDPGPRFAYSAAYDSHSDRIILYGGAEADGEYRSDTWAFDMNTNTWTNMSPSSSPGLRYGASMVYDAESNVMVLFGGLNYPEIIGHHVQQTWTYDFDSNTWYNREPTTQPIGRHHASMVYDSSSDRVILYGGYVSSAIDNSNSETWAYDVNTNTWQEMDPVLSPEGRFYGAMVYDTSSARTILYGGAWNYSNNAGLGDTWSYNYTSDTWEKMDPNPHPPERWRHSMAYRTSSEEVFLFNGCFGDILGGEPREDVFWRYDFQNDTWTNLDGHFEPPIPGAPMNPIVMTYDSAIILSWEPPSNETGEAITGYNVYRGTEENNLVLYTSLSRVLIYQDIGMDPGVTYYYAITAVAPAGEGPRSVIFSASIPPLFPILEVCLVSVAVLVIVVVFFRRRMSQQLVS